MGTPKLEDRVYKMYLNVLCILCVNIVDGLVSLLITHIPFKM